MALQPDAVILNGKYHILRLIGAGGMAHVWLAEKPRFGGQQVVIKEPRADLLPADQEYVLRRFDREVKVCAELAKAQAPHIVHALDAEPYADGLLLVLEYMPGGDLAALLKEHPQGLPIAQAVTIAQEVLQALAAVHDHPLEIVHRDVKPSNILFDARGQARLGDFGLAQVAGASGELTKLLGGGVSGTPLYAAPEQEQGKGYLTPAADLYALGCVLFEMLTGKRYKRVRPGTRASSLRAEVPAWLDEALARALQEDPWARYASAAEMAAALAEGEAQAQREAAEQARREAERRAQAEAEARRRQQEAQERQRQAAEQARREAERQRRERDLRLTLAPGVTLELVAVPAGEFLMGSTDADQEAYDDEKPQHKVYLDEYRIGKYPVTVAQFAAFVKATGYRTTAEQEGGGWTWTGSVWDYVPGADWQHPRGPKSDVKGKANHPVTLVSWDDAVAFCQWASQVTGRTVRLPTEAEWEKAARGGLQIPNPKSQDPKEMVKNPWPARKYPWGDEPPDQNRCNFDMHVKDTTPVGQYSPRGDSPVGCADMAGNVWEWCADWYDAGYYQHSPASNPAGPDSGAARVLRGGSFYSHRRLVRCAYRNRNYPSDRCGNFGFRVGAAPIPL